MDEARPETKSWHEKEGFQYSKNGQKFLDETIEKITDGVLKAAESKAESLTRKKGPVEVSEDHFRDAIGFILKKGTRRPVSYWFFRALITFSASFGVFLAVEGYRTIGNGPDKKAWLMLVGGVVVAILAVVLDKMSDH